MSRNESPLERLQVAWCAVVFTASVSAGADPEPSLPQMNLTGQEWTIRLDNWGHEPTMRIDLNSNGEIRVAHGRKTRGGGWQPAGPDWPSGFSGHVPQSVVIQAYEAARPLVSDLNLTDSSSRGIRDYDSGYDITVATARGSFKVWFVGSELYKDKVLKERLTRLVHVINEGLPRSVRMGRPHPRDD